MSESEAIRLFKLRVLEKCQESGLDVTLDDVQVPPAMARVLAQVIPHTELGKKARENVTLRLVR